MTPFADNDIIVVDLGFGDALKRALRSSRRGFDAEALVRAMVFNRLCDPHSKLGVLRWLETVAIPSMPDAVTHDQLLRTMDALMDRGDAVESSVTKLIRPLIDQELSVVFYDLTTVRIHGEGVVADDVRAFGMNKETAGIARQFVLGLVQTSDGLPNGSNTAIAPWLRCADQPPDPICRSRSGSIVAAGASKTPLTSDRVKGMIEVEVNFKSSSSWTFQKSPRNRGWPPRPSATTNARGSFTHWRVAVPDAGSRRRCWISLR